MKMTLDLSSLNDSKIYSREVLKLFVKCSILIVNKLTYEEIDCGRSVPECHRRTGLRQRKIELRQISY